MTLSNIRFNGELPKRMTDKEFRDLDKRIKRVLNISIKAPPKFKFKGKGILRWSEWYPNLYTNTGVDYAKKYNSLFTCTF